MNSDYHRLSKAYLASKEAFGLTEENFAIIDGYKQFLNVNNGFISMKSLTPLLSTLFSPLALPANMTEKQFNDILNRSSTIPSTALSTKVVPAYIFNFDDSIVFDGRFELFLGPFKLKTTIPKATYSLTTSANPKHHRGGSIGGSTETFSYSLTTFAGRNDETHVFLKIMNKKQQTNKFSSEKIGLFYLHESVDGGVNNKLRAKFLISFSLLPLRK